MGQNMSDRVKVLASERVYEGKLLKIDRQTISFDGEGEAVLEIIHHPGAAAALPFTADGQVVLVRQYRHAVGGFIFELPAGKLDIEGEAPELCAAREVEEETGYRAGRLVPLGSILTTPGFTDEVIWLYEAHDLEPVGQALEADEWLEVLEVPFEEAVAMVLDGRIRDAKSVATILRAELRRRAAP